MKIKYFLLILFIYIFISCFCQAYATEIQSNGGFESWSGGTPSGWSNTPTYNTEQPFDTLTQESAEVRSGSYSVKVVWNGRKRTLWQGHNVTSGKVYVFGFYLKDAGGGGALEAVIKWYTNSSGGYISKKYSSAVDVNSSWQKVEVSGVAPENAGYAKFIIFSWYDSGNQTNGSAYIDDAVIIESNAGETPTLNYTNGSFEVWSEGLPVRWSNQTCHGWGEAFDSVQQSSDAKHGSYSVQLTWNTGHTYNPIFYQEISVTGGQDYTFSFYAKAVSGTPDIEAKITFYDSAWGLLSYQYSDWTTITSSWNQLSVSATAPANAAYATVAIVGGKTSTGTIVVDEARLNGNLEGGGGSEGGETTTGGETGTTPSVSAASGELSVELSREAFSPYLGQSSQIVFQLGGAQSITYSIRIFDIKGNPVKDLVVSKELSDSSNQNQNDVWDGTDNLSSVLPPGNYIILVVVKDNVSGKIYTAKKRIVITF